MDFFMVGFSLLVLNFLVCRVNPLCMQPEWKLANIGNVLAAKYAVKNQFDCLVEKFIVVQKLAELRDTVFLRYRVFTRYAWADDEVTTRTSF